MPRLASLLLAASPALLLAAVPGTLARLSSAYLTPLVPPSSSVGAWELRSRTTVSRAGLTGNMKARSGFLPLVPTSPILSATSSRMGDMAEELSLMSHAHGPSLSPSATAIIRLGSALWKAVKKAGGATLAVLLGMGLVLGVPGAAHAAGMLADISTLATTNWNSVMSVLAASGFLQAFSLVFVSEIGDKTFFIAGLLAMKTSRLISFTGSMAALTVMTIISVVIGQVFHAIPQSLASGVKIDQVVAVLAFAYFGLRTLKEAYEMPEGGGMSGMEEEKAEAEKAVEESAAPNQATVWATLMQIFTLVFAAEFGDRSFLSTIALGAAQNPLSVATGAVAAHASATGIAVASGAFLSKYLSEKIIGYLGGSLFVIFAITTAFGVF